ncbi:hypothetical protein VTP01DRAFT_9405 [Rhizomucor pusillus]|uniref:uncharacterized protein n=1 Tax=Rhizomucor pusillus TaxID=4840 RepID=UPI0037438822
MSNLAGADLASTYLSFYCSGMTDPVIDKLKAEGVVPLSEIPRTGRCNVYGVIRTHKPLNRARQGRGDYYTTIGIMDPSVGLDERSDLRANLFNVSARAFEEMAPGDIFIGRNFAVNQVVSRLQAVVQSNDKFAQWSVLKVDDLSVRPKTERMVQFTPTDWAVARILQAWVKELRTKDDEPFLPHLATPATQSQTPMKRSASSDAISPVPEKKANTKKRTLRTEEFSDDVKFVDYLGMVVTNVFKRNRVEMTLTDFTPNPKPMDGYDAQRTIEPELLLQATLWDENANYCPDIQFGDYVFLRNAKLKISKLGMYELSLHGDRAKHTVNIHKYDLDHPSVQEIEKRKEEYWRRKMPDKVVHASIDSDPFRGRTFGDIPKTLVTNQVILQDKDLCKKYKVRTFVTAYKPKNIEDWTRKWCASCDKTFALETENCDCCHLPLKEYSYEAMFLVEDCEGTKLPVHLYGIESKGFFPDLPPAEPTPEQLHELSRRVELLSSKAHYFDLGIMSYAVPGLGRQYGIRSTQMLYDAEHV